jgi:hypothetical protein
MPRRGKSECVAEGLSQQVDVKIAGRGRTDKRTSTVLVVIPARVLASLCPDIDAQVRLGLLVLVPQNVKLRHVAVNADAAVADVEASLQVGLNRIVVIPKFVWLA